MTSRGTKLGGRISAQCAEPKVRVVQLENGCSLPLSFNSWLNEPRRHKRGLIPTRTGPGTRLRRAREVFHARWHGLYIRQ